MPRAKSRSKVQQEPVSHRLAEFDATFSVYSSTATFCLAYGLTNLILFTFGAAGEYARWPHDPLRAYGIGIARGFGYCINYNVALLLMLATRTLMTLLRSTALNAVIPFDKAMPLFHAFVGYATLVCAICHGASHSVGFARNMWALTGLLGWRYCVSTGVPLLCTFIIIVLFAHKPNRDRNYERFTGSHLVGATLFILLLFFHGVYLGKLYTYKWIVGPLMLYVLDRLYRKVVENSGTVTIRKNGKACLANGITKLELPRIFNFRAGQYAELKIPCVSDYEWHPFTIASAPHESTMVFYVKAVGDETKSWTNKLRALFKEDSETQSTFSDIGDVEVHCRGPYGAPAQHHGQYDRAVLISGGVGSTPFLSIAKHVDHIIRGFDLSCLPEKQATKSLAKNALGARSKSAYRYAPDDYEDDLSTGKYSDEEGDDEIDVVGFDNIGMSRMAGAGAVKNRNKVVPKGGRNAAGALKKRATMKRACGSTSDSDPNTEPWLEFFVNMSHSAVGNTLLLWLFLIRYAGNLMLIGLKDANMARQGTQLFRNQAATFLDLGLGLLVSGILVAQLFLEIVNSSLAFLDLILLLPLVSIQTSVHILYLLGVLRNQGSFTFNLIALVWPLGFACFLVRYFRIVGRRISLVQTVNASHRSLRSLDFVWTTPKASDDDWLCSDLASTIAFSSATSATRAVRLHRFITRESTPDVEAGESIAAIPGFKNNFGRPCWDTLFTALVNNSPNGTCIGVFVCGPPSLTSAVKAAALRAMIESRIKTHTYRGNQRSVLPGPLKREDITAQFDSNEVSCFGDPTALDVAPTLPATDKAEDWTRSFNVRFVVREENF